MKKKLQTLILILLNIHFIYAQKVNLDKYHFQLEQYKFPDEKLDTSFRTFKIEVMDSLSKEEANAFQEGINIVGWRKMKKSEKAHITIKIDLGEVPSEVLKEDIEKKDNNGNKSVVTNYSIKYLNEIPSSYIIVDFNGNEILVDTLCSFFSWSVSKTFASIEELNTYKIEKDKNYRAFMITRSILKINNKLTNKWGHKYEIESDYLWILNSKQHTEQDSMQFYAQFMKKAFSLYLVTTTNIEFKDSIQPLISYFENLPNKYKSLSKEDTKLRYSSYYNLAKIYYYLDDIDNCNKYARLLEENDYDKKDAKKLMAKASKLKEMFQFYNIFTRHYKLDVKKFAAPN